MVMITGPTCRTCNGESFRYCPDCQAHFCGDHLCGHLVLTDVVIEVEEETYQEFPSGYSWLSNDAIIASFPDAKLREALARYEGLVITIKMEIARREYNQAKPPKPRIPIAIAAFAKAAGLGEDEIFDFYKFVKEVKRENAKRNKAGA